MSRRSGTSAGYAADPDGAEKGEDLMAPPESAALNARGRRVTANVRRNTMRATFMHEETRHPWRVERVNVAD